MFLVAGTLEALVAMAQKHLERGVASPFLVSSHLRADAPESTLSPSHSTLPGHIPRQVLILIVLN
jgi:hypothetical protein